MGGYLVDDVGIGQVADNPQAIDLSGMKRKTTVTEISTKQVGIRLLVDPSAVAAEACSVAATGPFLGPTTTPGFHADPPVTNRSPQDVQATSDLAVVDPGPDQLQRLLVLRFRSHLANVRPTCDTIEP